MGGLSWETGEEQLSEYFGQFGEVDSINLKIDPNTARTNNVVADRIGSNLDFNLKFLTSKWSMGLIPGSKRT